MPTGLYSYLLSSADYDLLFGPAGFCDIVQQRGREVDFVPGYTAEMVEMLCDYLASECGIRIPGSLGPIEMHRTPIVARMNSQEARVLRNRLNRMGAEKTDGIFAAYGRADLGNAREGLEFFKRQLEHFSTNDERLVVLAVEPYPA